MSRSQWEKFMEKGGQWTPELDQSIPLVLLQPGDTLIMLPGNYNVYAPITLADCAMDGGMFWDVRRLRDILGQILDQILDQKNHPSISIGNLPFVYLGFQIIGDSKQFIESGL